MTEQCENKNAPAEECLEIVVEVLNEFYYSEDKKLLSLECCERAIAFRLGLQINCRLQQTNLDCVLDAEYNLLNDNPPKRIYSSCCRNKCKRGKCIVKAYRENSEAVKDKLSKICDKETLTQSELNKIVSTYMYPDLIMHKRGNAENNYVAIEIKLDTNEDTYGINNDKAKLMYLTCEESEYKYKYGLRVILGKESYIIHKYSKGETIKTYAEGKWGKVDEREKLSVKLQHKLL